MNHIRIYFLLAFSTSCYLSCGGTSLHSDYNFTESDRLLQKTINEIRQKLKNGSILTREDFEAAIHVRKDRQDPFDVIGVADGKIPIINRSNSGIKTPSGKLSYSELSGPLSSSLIDASREENLCKEKGYSDNCRVILKPEEAMHNCTVSLLCVPVPIYGRIPTIYYPSCVALPRCTGMCCYPMENCIPTKSVVFVKVHSYVQSATSRGHGRRPEFVHGGIKIIKMEEHKSCQCSKT